MLTDLYELTMAYAYWKSGTAGTEAVFHMSFRNAPFGSGFTVACGLGAVIDQVRRFQFHESDLAYLRTINAVDGRPLFDKGFLQFLEGLRFTGHIDAVPEGTVVFPQEPLLRVQGCLLQAQILESALLNAVNFQSLIATKAARICLAAEGEPVVEFGLRRAQGPDGALTASRAAYLGGCAGTSNVLAGQVYGIPVSGTHAHSWVMAFESELEAFKTYAEALPNNCILLVDTYDSLAGVAHAIEVGKLLRERGNDLAGIRLDSGDLAYLSIEARKLLDAAGFRDTAIYASNDLDEHIISSLKQQGARITRWGVGTKLVTSYDQPALGGVYKLSAVMGPGGSWQPRIKLSDQAAKITNPGVPQVRRFRSPKQFIADAIYDQGHPAPKRFTIVDPLDPTRRKHVPPETSFEDLLVPIFRSGKLVYRQPSLEESRQRVTHQLAMLHPGIKRFVNPHQYVAGLELGLHELKTKLVLRARDELEKRKGAA
ncbi:MAG TPA: nicotinate phosphoribosyltransferase [Verrucomicrobiae bacterium]|nr:nicotinate phosphoribosyltransferase [Verrucomicrobiae bacterium]